MFQISLGRQLPNLPPPVETPIFQTHFNSLIVYTSKNISKDTNS